MSDEQRLWATAFISLDGGEPPAEVKVIRGYGYVSDIDEKDKSMKITFMAHDKEGKPRRYLPSAWIPKSEESLVKILNASYSKKRAVFYRLEIRRQDGIDRKTPIEELTPLAVAKDSIFKGVAALKVRDEDDWIFSKAALTNPLEDPNDERFQSAVNKAPRNLSKSSDNGDSGPKGSFHAVEPPAFVTTTRSGEVNPGSVAVSAPLGAYSLASKLSRDFDLDLDKKKRGTLATSILRMSGSMQIAIWGGKLKNPDMGINSFNRARYFIEEVIATDEPLASDIFEGNNFKEWQERVEAEALKLWKWSVKMVEKTLEKDDEEEED